MKSKILPVITIVAVIIAIIVIICVPRDDTNTETSNESDFNLVKNLENELNVEQVENKENGSLDNNDIEESQPITLPKNTEEVNINTNVSEPLVTSQPKAYENVIEPIVSTTPNEPEKTDVLEIKVEDLSVESASMISYTSKNGITMGLLAIKDSNNNIDVAFNTCQICNGSPYAYFEQENDKLVCQNCGNTFLLDAIGASAKGCNPITISDNDVINTDTGITISKEFLDAHENLFKNWKKI